MKAPLLARSHISRRRSAKRSTNSLFLSIKCICVLFGSIRKKLHPLSSFIPLKIVNSLGVVIQYVLVVQLLSARSASHFSCLPIFVSVFLKYAVLCSIFLLLVTTHFDSSWETCEKPENNTSMQKSCVPTSSRFRNWTTKFYEKDFRYDLYDKRPRHIFFLISYYSYT